ncbi:LEAF RUST 10 DISEASE-RESISTANCE LOCUS RECEPTOR-LIKE PROTEIN KINASE-like 1.2 isoform X2 [Mercurialis annua]|uniref:LEAF RUST 10 DISEASE-RESISTANCE LOCUS RECEPTOR-LIKE PROTEIN KINASE-like 1.2 isoform X2 n=1 Tax=Mercurialis annua TaxID=3986 RepID=UPI00215F03B1|nr:LEAF RUST 10 DISEASE-RESISTANCE LOCUS RECEPTOR-LIKE PROTEIN KINASE-like 1.2 isoform X2 [Mercurialis annua]
MALSIFFFTSFICSTILVEPVLSAESKYETCKPKNCGNGPNISFPFYILNNETESCGHRGFDIRCVDHNPIYRTSRAHYILKEINYESQSFRLVDVQVFNSTCPMPSKNYSFDRSSVYFSPYHADIVFFYNCNNMISANYTVSRVSCNATAKNESFIALVSGDEDVSWNRSACESVAVAPVQLEEKDINQTVIEVDYKQLLKNGFTLKWMGLGFDCSECRKSGGNCGFEDKNGLCYCPDGSSHTKHCNDETNRRGLKLGLGLGGGIGLLALLSSLYIFRNRLKKRINSSSNFISSNSFSNMSSRSDVEDGGVYFGIPLFSYTELEKATSSFDRKKELGDGGFGTVYHGKLKDGREVAVKRLYEHNYRRVEQFMNEIEILTRLRHKNLVTLYGCTSRRSRELLLVYEYIPNGTVADHLHGDRAKSSPLTWPNRMSIAIETATALAYLHASDIIHRDVKTNNILLDNNFCVKVADFGLSRLFPTDVTHVSTAPQGTPGYVDPEYHQCYQLTDKSDVYSFGVVLVELITSMPAVDISRHRHEINLANLAVNKIQKCEFDELIDPSFGYKSDEEVKRMTILVAELAFRCLQQDKELRPSMDEVLEELQQIEHKDNPEEVRDGNNETPAHMLSQHSPTCCDEASLLKEMKMPPPSPNTVTAPWASTSSCSTTLNISS